MGYLKDCLNKKHCTFKLLFIAMQSVGYSIDLSAIEDNNENSTTMPIIDSYALLDIKINPIVIDFFPSIITDIEAGMINTQDAFFVIANKETPDTKKWENSKYWCLKSCQIC